MQNKQTHKQKQKKMGKKVEKKNDVNRKKMLQKNEKIITEGILGETIM